jgi:hypothetical protein
VSSFKFYCSLVCLSSLISISGCQAFNSLEAAFSSPKVIPIESLSTQTKQEDYIYLRGKVTNRAPFLKNGTYEVTDQTGQVWVLTSQPLPPIGETILVKGQLHSEHLSLAGQEKEQLYITEVEKSSENESELLNHQ